MPRRNFCLFIIAAITLLCSTQAMAWKVKTHRLLSQRAAKHSRTNTTNYLHKIGLEGFEQSIWLGNTLREIEDLIQDGAEREDAGNIFEQIAGRGRFTNHFHNPLEPWEQAGLHDFHTGMSSPLWAQAPLAQETFREGDWSWQRIRELYYRALTAPTETERQEHFARTFRGLGHQIHLIQDAAQPDHVRNDAHPVDAFWEYNRFGSLLFESWAAKNPGIIEALAATPLFPDIDLTTASYGLAAISQLIDTDQYDGTTPTASLAQGMAEYANANFFSDDTLFAAERYAVGHKCYFPYPKQSSTNLQDYLDQRLLPQTVVAKDGAPETGFWIAKTQDGEIIDRFVRPTYFTADVYQAEKRNGGNAVLYRRTFYRDEESHKAYASKLIPRAVGYSAALIDYFFRGQLGLEEAETGTGYVIVNNTDEEMEGIFEIYYDNTADERKLLWSRDLSLGPRSTAEHRSSAIEVPLPDNAKYLGEYMLVFRGQLGAEEGAVVGALVKRPPYVLRIALRKGPHAFYGFWDLRSNAEYPIRDRATGTVITQPIAAADIPQTTASALRWAVDTGGSLTNVPITGSLLQFTPHASIRNPFVATQSAAAAPLVRDEQVGAWQVCSWAYDVVVENWRGLAGYEAVRLFWHQVDSQDDLQKLYGASGWTGTLHFTNAPHFGTYNRAEWHDEFFEFFFWHPRCVTEYTIVFEGSFDILGVNFHNFLTYVGYYSDLLQIGDSLSRSVDYSGAYDMRLTKHGYVANHDVVADILLVPQFENHEIGPDFAAQIQSVSWKPNFYQPYSHLGGVGQPDTKIYSIREAPEVFAGFKVASGFSVKGEVIKNQGAHAGNWTDLTYATMSNAFNQRLAEWINSRFVLKAYNDLPDVLCTVPVRE